MTCNYLVKHFKQAIVGFLPILAYHLLSVICLCALKVVQNGSGTEAQLRSSCGEWNQHQS